MALLLGLAAAGCRSRAPSPEEGAQSLEDFSMTQTSSGRRAWTLSAPRARLFADGSGRLEKARAEIFRGGSVASVAEAEEAFIKDKSSDILLSGRVVIRSPSEKSVLRTDRLEFRSASNRFHTDSPLTIERPGGILRGRGLDADSALSEIRIRRMVSRLH